MGLSLNYLGALPNPQAPNFRPPGGGAPTLGGLPAFNPGGFSNSNPMGNYTLPAVDMNNPPKIPMGKAKPGNPFSSIQKSPDATLAPITAPVTMDQLSAAQGGANNSLQAQQDLLNALTPMSDLNQTQATPQVQMQDLATGLGAGQGPMGQAYQAQQGFNGQLAGANGIGMQTDAAGLQARQNAALAAANGVGTQNSAILGLQGLSGQYGKIAEGGGPNPAQAMLNQQTGANIANQAALMAGQRGAGANVGLMARQAAQQGAQTQQQAAGQAASMQAQQQLAAMGQQAQIQQVIGGLGGQQVGQMQAGIGQQAGIGAGLTGAQQAGLNAQAGQAQAQVQAQMAAQQQAAQQANVMAAQRIGAQQSAMQGHLANAGQMYGSAGQFNQSQVANQASVNAANAALSQKAMSGQQGMLGGAMNALGPVFGGMLGKAFSGSGAGAAGGAAGGAEAAAGAGEAAPYIGDAAEGAEVFAAHGGAVHHYALGTPAQPVAMASVTPITGPQSAFGRFLQGYKTGIGASDAAGGGDSIQDMSGAKAIYDGMSGFGGALANSLPNKAAKGGAVDDFRGGGKVVAKDASEKATTKGDSYDNDKIKAVVSEGEVILPRHVMQSKDPVAAAADFVRQVLAKRRA